MTLARHSREPYFLDVDASFRNCFRTSLLSSDFSTSERDCMLWHIHLGHKNFQYMKYLFSHIFFEVDIFSFL